MKGDQVLYYVMLDNLVVNKQQVLTHCGLRDRLYNIKHITISWYS